MPRGSKPGERRGGRQKGARNKRNREIVGSGLMPLAYMLSLVRDELQPLPVRTDMAKAAAPYCHPRLNAVEHTGKDGGPLTVKIVRFGDA